MLSASRRNGSSSRLASADEVTPKLLLSQETRHRSRDTDLTEGHSINMVATRSG